MKLTHEHEAIMRTATAVIDRAINPFVDEWEQAGVFPVREVFRMLGDAGLLGIHKPVACGGTGLDYSYNMVAAEAFGGIRSGGVSLAIGVQTDMATPALARFGSAELQAEFLAPAIAGEKIASIAVSEPGAGSDVAAIKTRACKDGTDYVINGSKMWITNAPQADFFCLLANTTDGHPHFNKSLIIVPADTPGVRVDTPLEKIGMRTSQTSQVFFDDVRVPVRYRIGEENQGFMMQMVQFQEERIWAAINSLRGMEICIADTIAYCKDRQAFGQPLINNQVVHFRLAELQTEVEALRALVYRTCERYVEGEDVLRLASMCKLKAGRLMREVTDSCVQYWGGNGFMWDNPASRMWRDGRLASIGGGTDEMMLGIICKTMGILPAAKPAAHNSPATPA
jgi:citronellyl-CoA dehydrogenase